MIAIMLRSQSCCRRLPGLSSSHILWSFRQSALSGQLINICHQNSIGVGQNCQILAGVTHHQSSILWFWTFEARWSQTWQVLELLGPNLGELMAWLPAGKFSLNTVVRIGCQVHLYYWLLLTLNRISWYFAASHLQQVLDRLRTVHDAGLVYRWSTSDASQSGNLWNLVWGLRCRWMRKMQITPRLSPGMWSLKTSWLACLAHQLSRSYTWFTMLILEAMMIVFVPIYMRQEVNANDKLWWHEWLWSGCSRCPRLTLA